MADGRPSPGRLALPIQNCRDCYRARLRAVPPAIVREAMLDAMLWSALQAFAHGCLALDLAIALALRLHCDREAAALHERLFGVDRMTVPAGGSGGEPWCLG